MQIPSNICYWCGNPSTSEDHFPPQSFFPQGKNTNLFKLPSCKQHNELLSKLDERFRFYFQGIAESDDAFELFKDKTMRGLQKEKAKGFTASLAKYSKWVLIDGKRRRVFSVELEKQTQYFEKLVRGAYFLAFGQPVIGRVVTASPQFFNEDLDFSVLSANLGPYLNDGSLMSEFTCPNPDIFRFRFGRVGEAPNMAAAIVILLYNSIEILGLITPEPST